MGHLKEVLHEFARLSPPKGVFLNYQTLIQTEYPSIRPVSFHYGTIITYHE